MLVDVIGKDGNEQLVVSSRMVADDFNKRHSDVLESIEKIMKTENTALLNMFFKTTYKADSNRKTYPMYLMNRDGFSLLVMGFTGNEAFKWKIKYIKAFNHMEAELKKRHEEHAKWEIERSKGVLLRHMLTDTIKNRIADSPNKKFMYGNFTKLGYKILFGMDLPQMREKLNVTYKDNVRDFLCTENLEEVQQIENLMSALINMGWNYAQIKDFLEKNYQKSKLVSVKNNRFDDMASKAINLLSQ